MDPLPKISNACPYCEAAMAVTRMTCDRCSVSIDATFPMSRLASLPVEHQRFIEMFVLAGGNLKDMAEHVGVSYPTLRSWLDKVIESLRVEIGKTRPVKGNPLDALDPGPSSSKDPKPDAADAAARLIKNI